jgi:hypothetical protein
MLHAHAPLLSTTVLVCMQTEYKRSTPTHTHTHTHTQTDVHTHTYKHTPVRLLKTKKTSVTTVLSVAVTPNQSFRSLAVFQPALFVHESPLVAS